MTEGLKQAGFKVLGAVEIEGLAAETYQLNHRGVQLWKADIRTVTTTKILKKLRLRPGQLDLLTGCPPCQGFSSMRRLNGRNVRDDRNDLLFDFLRFVKGLRPKTIMLENVPGLENYWRWRQFTGKLEALGYKSRWKVLNAADYGVPQRRRRLIFLATTTTRVEFQPAATVQVTVKDAISGLPRPGATGDELHDLKSKHDPRILSIIRRIPKNGGSRAALGKDQLRCHKKFRGFRDVYGRMAWNRQSPTITGGCTNPSKGRFLHPTQNRAISLREAALLQSFPDDYKFSLARGKGPAALLIGNALPPEFARRNVQPLLKYLKTATSAR